MSATTTSRLTDLIVEGLPPFAGAVAIARVSAERYYPGSDKLRPVVLCHERPNGRWITWGLTTLTHYGDGVQRLPAADANLVGIAGGYVWGGRAVDLLPEQIEGTVWAAPRALIEQCALAEIDMLPHKASALAERLHKAHVAAGWRWPKP